MAGDLIAHNIKRKKKELFTDNRKALRSALVTYPNHKDEAQSIARRIAEEVGAGRRRPRDYAIFYRVNALSRELELALREQGVPYQLVHGVEFFQRREIKDVLGYLRLVNNPSDDVALLHVINTPARGIGKTTLERLSQYAAREGLPMLEAARQAAAVEGLNKKALTSLAAFVALFDRLVAVAGGPVEEVLGPRTERIGLQKAVRDRRRGGPAAAGQHRRIAHRRPRVRRTPRRPAPGRGVLGRDQPGERHGRLGSGERSRHAHDVATPRRGWNFRSSF